jgi:hypothetical protein
MLAVCMYYVLQSEKAVANVMVQQKLHVKIGWTTQQKGPSTYYYSNYMHKFSRTGSSVDVLSQLIDCSCPFD